MRATTIRVRITNAKSMIPDTTGKKLFRGFMVIPVDLGSKYDLIL